MFFRTKTSGPRTYLQVVENRWEGGRSRQRVIATLGRLDELQRSGQLDALLISGARLAESVLILTDHAQGKLPAYTSRRIGPGLVFQRLWEQTGCQHVIGQLLKGRHYEFPVERAIFLTVLHRLFDPGSDRAADKWKKDYQIEGCETLQLHHLYRAMAWLGEELARPEQADKTPFAPRCTKDLIEERLFAHRRDLFTELQLVFFDTTSIYFEGQGGETIGQRGHSKDHRPDLKQMIVGVVLDGQGRPICCELWPGNTADVTTLIPVVDRLRKRFAVGKVCIVADRGMISKETIEELEKPERGWLYILGARMRSRRRSRRRSWPEQAAIASSVPSAKRAMPPHLWTSRRSGWRTVATSSVATRTRPARMPRIGRPSWRRFARSSKPARSHWSATRATAATCARPVRITSRSTRPRSQEEARYDGKWVLRTNMDLDAPDVALQYKGLWMVEAYIRSCKSLLHTRPIYHKCDETIRGHVFCSFLAMVLRQELEARLARRGDEFEWADVIADLDRLQTAEVGQDGKRFLLRSEVQGTCGLVFQAAGVAVPPTVQRVAPPLDNQEPDPSATPPL